MNGIEDLKEGEKINLEDLVVGKFYKGELIIDRSENNLVNMTTLEKLPDESEEIDVDRYLIKIKSGKVTSIMLNGYQECFKGDEDYEIFNKQIQEAIK